MQKNEEGGCNPGRQLRSNARRSSDQSTLPTVIWGLRHPTTYIAFFAKSKHDSPYTAPLPKSMMSHCQESVRIPSPFVDKHHFEYNNIHTTAFSIHPILSSKRLHANDHSSMHTATPPPTKSTPPKAPSLITYHLCLQTTHATYLSTRTKEANQTRHRIPSLEPNAQV